MRLFLDSFYLRFFLQFKCNPFVCWKSDTFLDFHNYCVHKMDLKMNQKCVSVLKCCLLVELIKICYIAPAQSPQSIRQHPSQDQTQFVLSRLFPWRHCVCVFVRYSLMTD